MAQAQGGARRRFSQAELDAAVEAHARFLTARPGGQRLTLRFADLSGLVLDNNDVTEADLTGSTLVGTRFIRADLTRASLFGCDLTKADLRGAALTRADLRGVVLRGANLSFADLTGADFRQGQIAMPHPRLGLETLKSENRSADLADANFSGATLDGSQMSGSSACNADFTDCSLRGAKLANANLKDANLCGANLEDAQVSGTNLEGANLSGAVLTGVDTTKAKLSRADLTGVLRDMPGDPKVQLLRLLERVQASAAWWKSGGASGAPARVDGEGRRRPGTPAWSAWICQARCCRAPISRGRTCAT